MRSYRENPAEEARIELIPLIDVIFCILTFFILAALQLTRQQAINLDLPKASSGVAQMRQMAVVSVDAFGQIYLEKRPITSEQLKLQLQVYKSQNPNGLMVLYASKQAYYNDVVKVLDLLKSVGGDRVALATLPGSNQPTVPQEGINRLGTPLPTVPIPNSPQAPPVPIPNQQIPNPQTPAAPIPNQLQVPIAPTVPRSSDSNSNLQPDAGRSLPQGNRSAPSENRNTTSQ